MGTVRGEAHHLYKHGKSATKAYGRWHGMIQRCTDPNHKNYALYGGRGIKVCARWMEYPNFLADMGEPPPSMSLDRINGDGDYTPSNCRWATHSQQMRNTSRTMWIELNGVRQCAAAWARQLGIDVTTLRDRIKAGWTAERALTPVKFNNQGRARNGV